MKKFRGVFVKNDKEIGLMREANRIVSKILDELGENVRPGVPTMLFEEICRKRCDEFGVRPAFLGYQGFPYALCCSVNEEIVHGFPSKTRIIEEGDIVSFDMGVVYHGFYGDSARTFGVGQVSEESQKLMDVTRESLYKGIEQAVPGNNLYDISAAIQSYVEGFGFGIVRRFVGHGIGSHLHEKPEIPNFVPKGISGVPLKAGMVLAIEPMVTVGSYEVDVLEDKWTAVTKDRKYSAHFEHTVAVTSDGPRILSVSD
ncbi:type I methionyl aminopeptidase [Pseudodesulfovibrio thermohalotolerans]|uniref:type I methionyl aminopeptidase n=1 Tax=Pseudodesulfovibrio thermohalotolerans TaxID=2880651 RepID=UPI0022B9DF81|nr:type I methionyl aminopeptidase [Pseudodesulfovibrio thermohalotolerans]WFS63693.1 type I methionyl aminopeptidase [Pseudodesulfovibrio thermohalotolerans]